MTYVEVVIDSDLAQEMERNGLAYLCLPDGHYRLTPLGVEAAGKYLSKLEREA